MLSSSVPFSWGDAWIAYDRHESAMCGKFEKPGIPLVYPRINDCAHLIIEDIFGNSFNLPENCMCASMTSSLGLTRKKTGKKEWSQTIS